VLPWRTVVTTLRPASVPPVVPGPGKIVQVESPPVAVEVVRPWDCRRTGEFSRFCEQLIGIRVGVLCLARNWLSL